MEYRACLLNPSLCSQDTIMQYSEIIPVTLLGPAVVMVQESNHTLTTSSMAPKLSVGVSGDTGIAGSRGCTDNFLKLLSTEGTHSKERLLEIRNFVKSCCTETHVFEELLCNYTSPGVD